ncbi:PREDICTED: TELO2-interacting protein 1 homolog [Tarenaya hassleriana]|uniref:TELO2-interacting protein 1 homolog n=1 Tax=Tarenaya hassleriana TaxID=28532 RepID=UPI00053C1629|nr:PREDICTED: TELO2-interacting protein 1 homolog [Tarenaya hassleriana]
MENSAGVSGGFTRSSEANGGVEGEVEREEVFAQLKGLCLELLSLSQNPKKDSPAIPALLQLLRRTPSSYLQSFFDYTLFPLLLLLDAAVACRSQDKKQPKEKLEVYDVLRTPYKVSDKVAEGVICCLEELLKKCCIRSVDQMVVILKKLTSAALLTQSEASEEFREGIIKSFRAMISGLLPCSDDSCSCKHSIGWPLLWERRDSPIQFSNFFEYDQENRECLLEFLQSQSASTAVGHWLSILLKAADAEAARGHRGSANLRVEAFMALRVLVAKVGTADALAFFLPGVVSQVAKVLHVSRAMISGAAGSVEALDQSIRALAEILMIVLEDEANSSALSISDGATHLSKHESAPSVLEQLRSLTTKTRGEEVGKSIKESQESNLNPSFGSNGMDSLHVERTKKWLETTSSRVNKLLCDAFPHICVHPASKVRSGLLAAIRGLLSKSPLSLKGARLVLLECVCTLAIDDSDEVSAGAQEFLDDLFSESTYLYVDKDVFEFFNRLLERLPKVVLGSDELSALSVAKQLLVIIYYSGPRFLADHLQSPITASRFLEIFALCLSHNSAFAGSLEKLIVARPSSSSSTGYLPSITELEAGFQESIHSRTIHKTSESERGKTEITRSRYELPRMPPWFSYMGSQKLYEMLSGVLRLVGLSLMAGFGSEGHLAVILDIPLGCFHKLISEVRRKEYSGEDWQSWYNRTGSGQLVRRAATASCILNEIIFGLSGRASDDTLSRMLQKPTKRRRHIQEEGSKSEDGLRWKISWNKRVKSRLIECVGKILHEYQSSEVWDIPVDQNSLGRSNDTEFHGINLHFYKDTAMLHQVIVEGVGIFSLCLGQDFASSGFLHLSLYLLLESLICSDFQVKNASDSVLHQLAATLGHPSVGHLVLANADYVIDSICRQLRHLDLNPNVPNVLAAMLSYVGVACEILPLLEEPMRLVSQELEIVGRKQHSNLTLPFLKAVGEIAKASKREAFLLPDKAKSYNEHVKTKASDLMKSRQDRRGSDSDDEVDISRLVPEEWETNLLELNRSKRYRRIVGSVTSSCLIACTPLLASSDQATCLAALDIIEEGVPSLAKVEEAYREETETKETIEELIESASLYQLKDVMDATDGGSDENRLLPAMNKIWPFFIVCVRNGNPVAVRRCLSVITHAVRISGGDFFARRFRNDGPHFWRLLSTSPFNKIRNPREDKPLLRLPYRTALASPETSASMAEASSLKVQNAVLNMIADLSSDKHSASALDAALKKVAGLVVGIACSGVSGLHDSAVNALRGIASIDPDLIWILLSDVYFSLKKKDSLPPPPSPEFPEISRVLLPPPADFPARFLYVEYGGRSHGFDLEFSSVEIVFKKMHALVFMNQMCL